MNPKLGAAVAAAGLTIATSLAVMWEGGPRYVAFKPIPTDPWTLCHGHTRGVKEGDKATATQCEEWLREDIVEAARAVDRCIDVPLSPGQLGAFIDAVYNLGPKVVCGSTLQRKANAGDMHGACMELTHALNSDGRRRGWSYAGGKFYQGLRNRRFADREACWPADFSNVRDAP